MTSSTIRNNGDNHKNSYPVADTNRKVYKVFQITIKFEGGFPGGAVVENLPANAGDAGSSPGLGRPHVPRSD